MLELISRVAFDVSLIPRTSVQRTAASLPDPDAIATITVTLGDASPGWPPARLTEFSVPPEYFCDVLDAFRPAELYDYGSPNLFLWHGGVTIITKQGQPIMITFWDGGKCPLHFVVDTAMCVRAGDYKPISIEADRVSYASESDLLQRMLRSLHEVVTTGRGRPGLQEAIEDLQRSRGERPPKRQ